MSGALPQLDAELPPPTRGLFTTRLGGVSEGTWSSLDLADHVGDEPDRVTTNRQLLDSAVGQRAVVFSRQVHGAAVRRVDDEPPGRLVSPDADAVVTASAGRPVGVLTADCLPVLLVEPGTGVVAAAHAGRRGLVAGILPETVRAMVALGADPVKIVAVIGPAVCGSCYEVPEALCAEVDAVLPGSAAHTRTGTPSLDLPAGAARQLSALGVGEVRRTGICTVEDLRFYSYRRDGTTGRFASVVVLP